MSKITQLHKVCHLKHYSGWCGYGKNMKRWKYWDNDKYLCCLTKAEETLQHIFKCKDLEMKAYKYELYKYIYSWLKKQDTQQMLLSLIMTTLFKHPFTLTQEYENYWGSTKKIYRN